ncbi:transposase [Streptomyces aureocirculatus]|uniref:transposase n=1 Tax=Streptomyces aureocirculatus TaxID=67275 RepID=UPI00384DB0DA
MVGQWQICDPPVLVVLDAGYALPSCSRICPLILGRMRSDRVLYFPPSPQPAAKCGRKPKHEAEFTFDDPAGPVHHHGDRHYSLRAGRRHGVGPPASTADPALGLGRPSRRLADPRRHRHPLVARVRW